MDGNLKQTDIRADHTRSSVSIHRKFFWTRTQESHSYKSHHRNTKRHNYNQRILKLISLCLTVGTATPTFASDVGGVSATANPVANSSGSVTNQAIQVLQGPYITNTYGGGIQCLSLIHI